MKAIMKRELYAYFSSPIGYVFLAIIYFFSGIYFFSTSLYSNNASLNYVFSNLFIIVAFLIPLITMRLLSEEKKQKTDQALFTAPVKLTSIAMGKYLGAIIFYLIGISITIIYTIVLCFFTIPDLFVVLGNFVGILLLGACLISIGMFLSAITENQIVAAVSGVAVSVFVIITDFLSSAIPITWLSTTLTKISFTKHYNDFTTGIFNLTDVFFFLSVSALFVFLTVCVFKKKRIN